MALSLLPVNPITLLVLWQSSMGRRVAVPRHSDAGFLRPTDHGENVNGKAASILGWAATGLTDVAAIALFAAGGGL